MVLLIPEGVVFLLCGLFQHLHECLPNKRHGLLKAIEGVAKALLAVANLCLLYYTNAPISEDLMLLKSTIYAFFFVSACVDLSVCVKLVPVWFTPGPTAVLLGVRGAASLMHWGEPGATPIDRMTYIEGVVCLVTSAVCVALLFYGDPCQLLYL